MNGNNRKNQAISRDIAEHIATQALGFIAGDPTRLGRFLAESGLGPETIRQAAKDPSFMPALLDFLLAHENDLVEFAAHLNIDPRDIPAARRAFGDIKLDS